jgi:hypothetical protein
MHGQVDVTNTAMLRGGPARQEVQEIAMQAAKAALPQVPAPDDLAMNAIDPRAVEGEVAAAAGLVEVQAILQHEEAP